MGAVFREEPDEDSRHWVNVLDQARELAAACPDTSVVSVCDRSADPLPMLAASGTKVEGGNDPLHYPPLTTERPAEGEADALHAATVLDWYRTRWAIETWCQCQSKIPHLLECALRLDIWGLGISPIWGLRLGGPMSKRHRCRSTAKKRDVVEAYLHGEALQALGKQHDMRQPDPDLDREGRARRI